MRWFGRKAGRETARPFLLGSGWGVGGAAAAPWPQSYEAQVREAYLGNAVAQRCVRIVAEAVGSVVVDWHGGPSTMGRAVPLAEQARTTAASGGGPSTMLRIVPLPEQARATAASGGGPSTMLRMVPLPEQARGGTLVTAGLLETCATQLLLHGNAFVHLAQDGAGMPAGLFALRPERVKVESDAGGWPVAYRYKAGAAERRYPAVDPLGKPGIVHLKLPHPLDDHYGLGCLHAAAAAVAVHNAAARWNQALLDNAARPSGALVHDGPDGAVLSQAQFDRLKEEMAAQFAGSGNAGRPLLLDGGLKWQAMSLTPADMDFVGLKAAAAREIALAFGVPPMLVGLPGDNAYANYREAVRSLWRLTVLPMAGRILDGVGEGLQAWWPGLRLAVDVDQVSALHADRADLWAAVGAAGFLTDGEKREMLGFAREAAR